MTKNLFVISFLLLLSFYGCSTQNENDLMESAKKNVENEQYKEAINDYEKFIADYPHSKNLGIVNFELAKLYQGKFAEGLTKKESMEKAIEHYKVVYEDYPEMKEAPSSLFMTGFIQANELHKFDDAKETYNLFIKRYPDHELAASAQNELDNLGLSPEEILRKSAKDIE